jgi:hypothetical protein
MSDEFMGDDTPTYLANYRKGELSLTVKSGTPEHAVKELVKMVEEAQKQVIFQGTQAVQPAAANGVKCPKCGSSMTQAIRTKKDNSGTFQVYNCMNTNCKTQGSNGKMYQTSIPEWELNK